ncbi:Endopolyphosphatase [Pichia californica]|uniref:Endopolyphosphatase n=1 Tax=Pichia californica TaxID=460514 RepID=A0A9P7BGU2_9ASCO|nr:Endopolyphosphatase [[Candida] californica]KAG0689645.1 Endopolyphosphatase [[Candida] californica]
MDKKNMGNKLLLKSFLSITCLFIILSFIFQNSISNKIFCITSLWNKNENDITISQLIDTAETIDHLEKLNLTPHHSIQFLSSDINGNKKLKTLHGRFLHITDLHPDELNVIGGAIRRQCHKKVKNIQDNTDISHKYGDSMSGCDSPIDLYRETLDWIRENLKDHIDFVIWTGDNIRHDNDRSYPRTEYEIFEMNEKVADDMTKTFMDDDEEDENPFDRRVKLVPSLGNNDVYPHNLFAPGPTLQTRELYKIWRDFIPTEQMHTFDRGAYYLREVFPGKLVVLSINTLYWFQSNPLNDNCDARKQPGYKLLLWLGATLKECRRRGLKVWLSGHVPPIPKNIHHSCYAKISVWMHEYRDLIIGGVWGHMNIDHWVPLDSVKAWKSINKRLIAAGALADNEELPFVNYDQLDYLLSELDVEEEEEEDDDDDDDEEEIIDHETIENLYTSFGYDLDDETSNPLHTFSDRYMGAPNGKVSYLKTLRNEMYGKLKGKKKSGRDFERYSIAHISASVIPTYNPGLRVWEYNITEFADLYTEESSDNGSLFKIFKSTKKQQNKFQESDWNDFFEELERQLDDETKIEKLITEMENDISKFDMEKYVSFLAPSKDKTIPTLMPQDLPLGPAYTPQSFTPEKYTQYYIDLNDLNYGKKNDIDSWIFEYKTHYSTDKEYGMDNLLVKSWIDIGRKYAKTIPQNDSNKKSKKMDLQSVEEKFHIQQKFEKMWNGYIDKAFMSSGYQELPDSVV